MPKIPLFAPVLQRKSRYLMPQNLLKSVGTLVEDFEDFTDWVVNHGGAADDVANYQTGTQSVKVTSDVGGEGEIQLNNMAWPALGNNVMRIWFYVADVSLVNVNACYIEMWDTNYSNKMKYTHPVLEGKNLLAVGPDDWTLSGSAALTDPINHIRIRSFATGGNQSVISYDSLYFEQISEPAVVISFDDCHGSQYDTAYPILKAKNMVATAYLITDDMGKANFLSYAECLELQANGWCIGNHSNTHTNFTTLTEAEIETELTDARDLMVAGGITGNGPYHVSYPAGAWDADTLNAMSDTNMLTGRTTTVYANPCLPIDRPFEMPIWFDLDNGTSLATAKTKIDDLVANKRIGYIYGHAIKAAADASSWAESDFLELCAYIAQKRMVSLNIDEAYLLQSGSVMCKKAR